MLPFQAQEKGVDSTPSEAECQGRICLATKAGFLQQAQACVCSLVLGLPGQQSEIREVIKLWHYIPIKYYLKA